MVHARPHHQLSDEFAHAPGRYFDNDAGRFAEPHPGALDPRKTALLVQAIEALLRARQTDPTV